MVSWGCLVSSRVRRSPQHHSSGLYKDDLSQKATELWQTIVRLETEKYDLQERQKRQDYDVSNSQ